jgi:bifunctional enzyme CysN/CysC
MSDILRFVTAGSVDDGKSTLIGRLLHDSESLFEDQLTAVARTSAERGEDHVNLALLTDGLRAEREQGITIDVAYRYFSTARRKFIIADTPGHVQYTRNMITGASTADLAIILIDARNGIQEQSRRHALIATLLNVRHLVLAVNKMDLVGYGEEAFNRIRNEFTAFSAKLAITDLTFMPVSALYGDNIVDRSPNMPWYTGATLLHHLENVHIASDKNLIDLRFPIQYVVRPHRSADPRLHDYRGYAGQLAAGVLRVGDEIMHLPSGLIAHVIGIDAANGPVQAAFPPMSVTLRLAEDIDVARGDMFSRPNNQPTATQDLDAMVCWMADNEPLTPGSMVLVKHTTRMARALIRDLAYRLDINTLRRDTAAKELRLNEVGRLNLRIATPLYTDDYQRNRLTGGFIMIDPASNSTAGAGMITNAKANPWSYRAHERTGV